MSRARRYALPILVTVGIVGAAGLFGWAIIQNYHNRRDINRIISPSPEEYQRGINMAIARLTPAQAAAIFRKLPASVREELRGPRGPRGHRGARGARGQPGGQGTRGRPGPTGIPGAAGRPAPRAPRATPPPARSPAPRAPAPLLIRPTPPAFPLPQVPGVGPPGVLPNDKPCPPLNPHCK